MSELEQLERLQKTIREIANIKIVEMPISFENEVKKISKNKIYLIGQSIVIIKIKDIIKNYKPL